MEPRILLSQLQTLLASAPTFDRSLAVTPGQLSWLGYAHALVARWNKSEATTIKTATNFLGLSATRESNVTQIFGVLYRAVADLEIQVAASPAQAFGPGAMYDFFKALREVLGAAERQVLIVDPYVDASIFDTYLTAVRKGVGVRILAKKAGADLKAAAERYAAQHHSSLEVRTSKAFHDRAVFVDGPACWVIGQSIEHAARSMPTYLAPLSPDVAESKLESYDEVWRDAKAI